MADDGAYVPNQQELVRQIIAHMKTLPTWDGKTFDHRLTLMLRELQRTAKEKK